MISSACPNISPTVSSPINQNSIKVNLLRDNIDLYNVDTRLIDIKPEHLIFVGIFPSLNLIPSSYLKHTRDLFTQAFRNCLSSTSSSIDWIKLMLLPIILFTSNDKKKVKKEYYKEKLINLRNNNWDSFTLGSLPFKTINNAVRCDEENIKSAMKLCKSGNLTQ